MGTRLAEKTVVVTGGASGIGAAIARGVAAEGANVMIADLDLAAGQRIADDIVALGGAAAAVQADVTDRAAVRSAIEATVSRFGRLDVYFNNAGMNSPMRFLDITERNFETVMKVNALGVLTCPPRCSSRRAIPTTSRVRSSPSRAA